jgi:hypothetical protein
VALRAGGKRRNRPHVLWRFPVIRGANVMQACSMRKRGAAGPPVFCPDGIGTLPIIDACRSGTISNLLDNWQRGSNTSCLPCAASSNAGNAGAGRTVALPGLWEARANHAANRVRPVDTAA